MYEYLPLCFYLNIDVINPNKKTNKIIKHIETKYLLFESWDIVQ